MITEKNITEIYKEHPDVADESDVDIVTNLQLQRG
jgi:hypothetical protein